MLSRINLSGAIIVLVCFFLPWMQVSCGGAHDSLSGLDLARQENALLWLVPLSMCAVLVFGLLRLRAPKAKLQGILSTCCGLIVLFLMNREREHAYGIAGLVTPQLTGWFWLAFISAATIVVTGIILLLKRPVDAIN
jgi:hypothetical protein